VLPSLYANFGGGVAPNDVITALVRVHKELPVASPAYVSFCFANFWRASSFTLNAAISDMCIEDMPWAVAQSALAVARGVRQSPSSTRVY